MIIDYKQRYEELVDAMGYQVDKFDEPEEYKKLLGVVKFLLKVKTAFMTSKPEDSGTLFITGVSGDKDEMGLPEYVSICPTYGLDGFATYKKSSDYTSPDY